jgi:hypothetical protein
MKQTSRGSLKSLFREVMTSQTNDVLTCCRTVVNQYCRMELLAQTSKSPIK